MTGRRNIGSAGFANGKTESMRDTFLIDYFIVSDQAGKNGETGGVRRRPSRGPQMIRTQIKDRPAVSSPALFGFEGMEQLIKPPLIAVNDQDVAISIRFFASFNGDVLRNRVDARVALIGVFKPDSLLRLIAGNNHIRDPRAWVSPEVRMQGFI